MSIEDPKECPCKKINCERHGNCEACRKHHETSKYEATCVRLEKKLKKTVTTKEDKKIEKKEK